MNQTDPTAAHQTDGADCPHCPDGHQHPEGGSQPWSAWVDSVRDGDGQPMQITVARSAGAHVAESDAQWVRERLNAPAPYAAHLPLDHPLRRECRCSEAGVCRRCSEVAPGAASAVVAPPTDRAALLDVAAQAIRDSNGTPEALAWWTQHPQLIPAHVYADAVLAVLPEPTDRAADAEPPLSPDYEHPDCGFHWHGRDGMDIPMRDGQPVCPRCELAAVEKRLRHSEKLREELRVESRRRGKVKLEYAERIRLLENQLDEVRSQLGAEILRAGRAEAEARRLAVEAHDTGTQQPECSPACGEQHTYSPGCALAGVQQQPDRPFRDEPTEVLRHALALASVHASQAARFRPQDQDGALPAVADLFRTELQHREEQTPADRAEELMHVGWWCWRGNDHGHLATMACRSDNVPIHVPAEWADEMRAVIQRIEDGDDEPAPVAQQPAALVRSGDATVDPAMCPRCKGDNSEAFELCHACAQAEQQAAAADGEEHVCRPGATVYYCPTAGEVESDCHGGFDVCCGQPDLHQPIVAYRNSDRPGVLLCRKHGEGWVGLTPLTAEDLPDGGICTWSTPAAECGVDVLAEPERP